MTDVQAETLPIYWDRLKRQEAVWSAGDTAVHSMLGKVSIIGVDLAGDFPLYSCRQEPGGFRFRTSAAFLSAAP